MQMTVWSNAGKSEFILSENDATVFRSGLIYSSNAKAEREGMKKAKELLDS